jgi:HAD superfamily hydrolase (TIGR01509 family)
MLGAVIFDMDGLLIDTEWHDYHSWCDAFAECGGELRIEEWVRQVGVWGGLEEITHRLALLAGAADRLAAVTRRRRESLRRRVQESMEPMPGVIALLDELEERRIPRAVASSSETEWVRFVLGGMGIGPRLNAIVTGDDVRARKPAPDVYLCAAERVGVDPARCVALEDSATGIAAALAAGMRCVAVPNRLTCFHDLSAAHAQVSGLSEVTVEWLAELCGK